MEELLFTLRSHSWIMDLHEENTDSHDDKNKLAELIDVFHQQTAQWSQFMSTEMGFN